MKTTAGHEDRVMVPFSTSIPLDQVLSVRWRKHRYFVVEMYCVDPGCSCTAVQLGFVRKKRTIATELSAILWFDYRERRWAREFVSEKDPVDPEEIARELEAARPDLPMYLNLKHELARCTHGAGRVARKPPPPAAPPGDPRVGRNAPCPCGSGRKFKKCCGGVRENS